MGVTAVFPTDAEGRNTLSLSERLAAVSPAANLRSKRRPPSTSLDPPKKKSRLTLEEPPHKFPPVDPNDVPAAASLSTAPPIPTRGRSGSTLKPAPTTSPSKMPAIGSTLAQPRKDEVDNLFNSTKTHLGTLVSSTVEKLRSARDWESFVAQQRGGPTYNRDLNTWTIRRECIWPACTSTASLSNLTMNPGRWRERMKRRPAAATTPPGHTQSSSPKK